MRSHTEVHLVERIGWLRAAVLGANDGIVSTASLIVGVAAASTTTNEALVAGVTGLVAGAMSMAAGEYVSVSSQSDTERADLARERAALQSQPEFELEGLEYGLVRQVAEQLTARNALETHARDELGIVEHTAARPVQAALTSAATFAVGAALPLVTLVISPQSVVLPVVFVASLVGIAGCSRGKSGRSESGKGDCSCHILGGHRYGLDRVDRCRCCYSILAARRPVTA